MVVNEVTDTNHANSAYNWFYDAASDFVTHKNTAETTSEPANQDSTNGEAVRPASNDSGLTTWEKLSHLGEGIAQVGEGLANNIPITSDIIGTFDCVTNAANKISKDSGRVFDSVTNAADGVTDTTKQITSFIETDLTNTTQQITSSIQFVETGLTIGGILLVIVVVYEVFLR